MTIGWRGGYVLRRLFRTQVPEVVEDRATPGRKVGKYDLIEELGKGGMGVVWKAHDPELDRMVGLKLILAKEAGGAQALERFVREAKLAARLRHPNILTVHEVGDHEGDPYLAMDFVEGASFHDFLDQTREAKRAGDPRGHANLREEVRILADVASAVAYAHSRASCTATSSPSTSWSTGRAGHA